MVENSEIIKEISSLYSYCRMCGTKYLIHSTDFDIDKLESHGYKWIAHGSGTLNTWCNCPMCAMQVHEVLEQSIYISKEFPCPKCGKKGDFNYYIKKIDNKKDNSFEFLLEIVCKKCSNGLVQKIFDSIRFKSIELKTDGLKIEIYEK